ncbi:fluoride efflux transporter FluC [Poseidonibacter antarcticus]|uniref:fluoride efflux transporter FluC n=1 Tax=Poseidonibacter antarcticus TaxID=2478538 RepID=UPI000EF4A13A|nr:CrcB family protein [Poseidonibacter antarcticus]
MPISWQTILAIGAGGFLGAIIRAYSVHFSNKYIPLDIPVGVLIVNIIGSFIIGILFAYFAHITVSESLKAFLTTGFLGALTTYSTFAIESYLLFGTSIYLAITNILLNVFGTIISAGMGYKLIHFLLR